MTVTGLVTGRRTEMLVDTGSAVTIVREDVWRGTLPLDWRQLVASPQHAVAASGQEYYLLGQSDTLICVGGLTKKHTVLIACRFSAETSMCGRS